MSILSRLFGGGKGGSGDAGPAAAGEDYQGFRILPDPIRDGGKFRIAATISKEVGGETKTHMLIRADTLDTHEDAAAASIRKARQMIDEQGDRLFG
jgi:hypothetical protein